VSRWLAIARSMHLSCHRPAVHRSENCKPSRPARPDNLHRSSGRELQARKGQLQSPMLLIEVRKQLPYRNTCFISDRCRVISIVLRKFVRQQPEEGKRRREVTSVPSIHSIRSVLQLAMTQVAIFIGEQLPKQLLCV
jgi:hypothetical protein